MKSVYPNKFFEYISSSIPVVTTALPELEIFKEYLGFSKDNNEFMENCQKAVDGEYLSKVSKYDEIKKNNDWDSIIKEIIKELRKLNWDY
jgi:glycosyltransferase involved in cell wall biosynthesis